MIVPVLLARLLSTSAIRHSKERQRVVGVLVWAADTEFDVPSERRWIHRRVERCRHGISEPRECIDAVDIRDEHQRVVPERQVVAAVIEDVERDLSRCVGSIITFHVPVTMGPETGSPSQ
jgi:hypothetical protein